jgi:hypothetical protein
LSAISSFSSASPLPSSYQYRPSLRSRAASLGLTLAMFALVLFILLRMAAWHAGPGAAAEKLVAVRLSAKSADAHKQQQTKAKARQAATQPQPPRPTPQSSPQPVVPPLHIIKLSRAEFAASDISKMARQPAGNSSASQDSGTTAGPGEGPGGAHLYNAEWFREPTHAEMVTYMPVGGGSPGSWGMIACRTIEHNHVEDCRELAESPAGSGLARALRRASWQFLVRPPRVDGRKLIGSWVRIRFDFIKAEEQ